MLAKLWNVFEEIILFFLGILEKITKKQMSKEQKEGFLQFVKFSLVGVSNTVLTYIIYYILLFFNINYQVANAIGYFAGICNSFYWNNKFVFKEKEGENRSIIKAFIKCVMSYMGGYVVSVIILFVWVQVLQFSEFVAPIINLIVTVPLNFIMNKLWAFKSNK